ncbi:MAG: hypothetical protein CMM48_15925 [Rhodospirillaceae bacterium]|nr:hypothetical protein [Rhodospirillaceae bacterium]|tara:strand:+ start:220 stop:687 length:468 start_codon:yes stop_codon:yes gene_type:complete
MSEIEDKKDLQGLGGWLVLVGLGLVLTPIRLIYSLVTDHLPLFESNAWQNVTAVHPLLPSLLWGEIILNLGMVLVSLYLLYLFFATKKQFPKIYIGLVVFALVFILTDALIVQSILPNDQTDADTIKEIVRIAIMVAIWVPYMLRSKRVKATFIR